MQCQLELHNSGLLVVACKAGWIAEAFRSLQLCSLEVYLRHVIHSHANLKYKL